MLKKLKNEPSGFTGVNPFDTGRPELKIAILLVRDQHPDGPEPFLLPGRHALDNDVGTDLLIAAADTYYPVLPVTIDTLK